MKIRLQITSCLALIAAALLSLPQPATAQIGRAHNKYSNPYRSNYQRMGSGCNSNSSFEIRGGTLWAWGYNGDGELGDGTTTDKSTPTQIGTDTKWVSIACGSQHTIAIKSDGTLWAWGSNGYGQLGDGTAISKLSPTQIGADTKWVSIACGLRYTVALKSDGTLWAWGYNGDGELGDGTVISKLSPTQIGADTKWVSIACGQFHTIALKSDGTLWSWGYNGDGQLGDGSTTDKSTPTQIGADTKWVSIACGLSYTVALKSDGTLWAWGYNPFGQLGDGTTIGKLSPTQIGADTKWVSIACGTSHTTALKSDGTLWAWGYNGNGQLGDGTTTPKFIPTQIGSDTKWVSIIGGQLFTIALKSDGTLWAWGYNGDGALGDGTTTQRITPTNVRKSNRDWLSISTGGNHSSAIKSDGTLWSWGYNGYGELGLGYATGGSAPAATTYPQQVGSATTWVSVSCGAYHAAAIQSDGSLWAWGQNGHGALGSGTLTDTSSPARVGTDNDWVSVACGGYHTVALKSDGTLWAWGYNGDGELGDGTTTQRTSPVQIAAGSTWVSISAGMTHTACLKNDGTLWATGENYYGEIGNNSNTSVSTLTQSGPATNWTGFVCGGYHTIGLRSDGSLWAWGNNNNGEVGDGTTVNKKIPTQIGSAQDWMLASAGITHTYAIKSDGTLYAWGENTFGELGDGTFADKNAPTLITGQAAVASLQKGGGSAGHSAILKADRSAICFTGNNTYGQLGDGSTTSSSSYTCANIVCRAYSLVSASGNLYTRRLSGAGSRTDFQSACTLAASLAPAGGATAVSGSATTQVFIDGSVQSFNGYKYAQRHYDILPATNATTATGTITLYFTQGEFTAYNAAAGAGTALPTGPADATGIANLRVTQYHGMPGGGYAPGNYPATWGGAGAPHVLITPTAVAWNSDDSRWEVTFGVTGFSGFFVSGNNAGAPLPLKMLAFTASKAGNSSNRIDWTTAVEDAGALFEVTRSGNGASFEQLGTVGGKGNNSSYAFYDEQPPSGINYYRLRITAAGGEALYSNIAIVRSGGTRGSVTIAPQPATNSLAITNTDASLTGKAAIIYDMQGRELFRFAMDAVSRIDVSSWAAGIYSLRLPSGEVVRIVKQ